MADAELPPHGTNARYQVELRGLLVPCDACKAAGRTYGHVYQLRTSRKCSKGLGWPLANPRLASLTLAAVTL